jgi:hypothetical protein
MNDTAEYKSIKSGDIRTVKAARKFYQDVKVREG